MDAAMGRGNAILQPAGGAERAHPAHAGRVNVAVSATAIAAAMSDIGSRIAGPLVDLVGERSMFRVEEWQAQMRGPAHDGSP